MPCVGQDSPCLGEDRTEQADVCMQVFSSCLSIFFWIPARSPHTISFSCQNRKRHKAATTSCFLVRNESPFDVLRCMASFWVGGKISETLLQIRLLSQYLVQVHLEATLGMKANGCGSRRTKTPVKAKWISPLPQTAKFYLPLTLALPASVPECCFFHPVNEKGHFVSFSFKVHVNLGYTAHTQLQGRTWKVTKKPKQLCLPHKMHHQLCEHPLEH